jgi:pyruvate,orthophosphate dikinase
MVFGNMGFDSATGVAFTRNPATGEKALYGEYLPNAQGEDVVAGIRTPLKITNRASQEWAQEHGISEEERRLRYPSLEELMPETYRQFLEMAALLERHYRDVQDLEFTIERGRLWMLQTRTGKRTAKAAVKIAVDMAHEGLITKEEAVMRVEPEQINQLLLPRFDEKAKERARDKGDLLARGLNASPGAATGHAVFDADTAEAWGRDGRPVILVRPETTPDDVHGMIAARGILTQRGGATSHAAVVARGLGKPAVVGCEALQIDLERKQFSANGRVIREGDFISIDGSTGEVFAGQIHAIDPNLAEERELAELLSWADEFRRLQVWANADYPRDARKAREFGAEGIGLARTEHMFFETDRLPYVRQMILNAPEAQRLMDQLRSAQQAAQARPDDPKAQKALREAERAVRTSQAVKAYRKALDRLLPVQRKDFEGLFEAMDGLPVIIRLIDPPMHEFLPRYEELLAEVVELRTRLEERRKIKGYRPRKGEKSLKQMEEELAEKEALLRAVNALREMNPMLGLRGIRLGILYPDIIRLQVRAIFEAACNVKRRGIIPKPEIMIPLSADLKELQIVREIVDEVAQEVIARAGVALEYKFGTMIELPRAALLAGEIAQAAEFFSFGTNDLTQTIWAISRDDAEGKFLLRYLEEKIIPENPFQVLDRKGVGRLMGMAVEEGRRTRPDLEVGICGEHGGDPSSIEFCHEIGLNYVSASPYRVPVARLAAAHAALKERAARIETR